MMIKGKKILLLMPNYYSLKKEIEIELIKQEAIVDYIETRVHKEDFLLHKTLLSFLYFIINPFYKKKYTKQILDSISDKSYDYLFVVGIYGGTNRLMKVLKERSEIKTIYYFWDAFITWDFSRYIKMFDVSYTFDMNDYSNFKEQGIYYLPLFYSEDNLQKNMKYDKVYDIVSIGTISPMYKGRLALINHIGSFSETLNIFLWYYVSELNSSFFKQRSLTNKMKCIFQFVFNNTYRRFILALNNDSKVFIHDTKMPENDCKRIEYSAKSILDINIDNAGCSYRIISALSRGIKVLTTNINIINETFYSPNNICIIDKKQPNIDSDFFKTDFEKIDMTNLRIDNWLKTIFANS